MQKSKNMYINKNDIFFSSDSKRYVVESSFCERDAKSN